MNRASWLAGAIALSSLLLGCNAEPQPEDLSTASALELREADAGATTGSTSRDQSAVLEMVTEAEPAAGDIETLDLETLESQIRAIKATTQSYNDLSPETRTRFRALVAAAAKRRGWRPASARSPNRPDTYVPPGVA
ncbi:MAG TPA: hypothetical protein VFG83_00900, partial [Kofleriaceae bacterium]|nr:hypothetical protein [Kofleriaceae bacterium]